MKAKVILVLLVILLSACKNLTYHYYTKINADGTIYKRIVAEGDSSLVYSRPFSFEIGNGWKVRYDKRLDAESKDTLFMAVAEKVFQNIADVNQELFLISDSVQKDNIVGEHDKHFMGFFTFHRYKETFKQRFPFKHLSITDYLTEEEYAYFFEGDTACLHGLSEDETKMFEEHGERKFGNYLLTSLGIEFMRLLDSYASVHNCKELTSSDSLFVIQLFVSSSEEGPDLESFCSLVDERLGAGWVSEARCSGYFSRFEEQIDNESILLDDNQYYAEVDVPGVLYATNATAIEDNLAKWHFKRGSFLYKDYELTIEYRTINYWFFAIIGLLLIVLVGAFVIIKKKSEY